MSGIIKTSALILHSIRWKESSKIVTFYTREKGLIKVIVHSALKKNSIFAGKLESLTLVNIILDYKESRSLQILRDSEVSNSFSKLKSDYGIYPYALLILELINQIFDFEQEDSIFYDFTIVMLKELEKKTDTNIVILYFLLKLASYLGFKPAFDLCLGKSNIRCAPKVFLDLQNGSVFCRNCELQQSISLPLKKNEFIFIQNLQKQHHRRISSFKETTENTLDLIYKLLNYLNRHLDKDLKTESLQLII